MRLIREHIKQRLRSTGEREVPSRKVGELVMSELRKLERPFRRLMFAGGGNIGRRLAKALESSYRVKVIERDLDRCKFIAEALERTIVLHGDAADEELLLEENIEDTDVFCAVTHDDEANILSAMLAKRLGARKVMALNQPPIPITLPSRPEQRSAVRCLGEHFRCIERV